MMTLSDEKDQYAKESIKLAEEYIDNVYSRYNKSSDYTSKLVDTFILECKLYTSHYDLMLKSFLNIFTILLTALLTLVGFKSYINPSNFKLFLISLIILEIVFLLIVIYILWLRHKKISELKPIMWFARENALMLLERVNATILLGINLDKNKREILSKARNLDNKSS